MKSEYNVIWSSVAEKDLLEIVKFISQDSISTAKRIMKSIRDKASTLRSFPKRGRVVPELRDLGVSLYRELIIEEWRLIYRIQEDTVLVLAVLDSRRDLESILFDRLARN